MADVQIYVNAEFDEEGEEKYWDLPFREQSRLDDAIKAHVKGFVADLDMSTEEIEGFNVDFNVEVS